MSKTHSLLKYDSVTRQWYPPYACGAQGSANHFALVCYVPLAAWSPNCKKSTPPSQSQLEPHHTLCSLPVRVKYAAHHACISPHTPPTRHTSHSSPFIQLSSYVAYSDHTTCRQQAPSMQQAISKLAANSKQAASSKQASSKQQARSKPAASMQQAANMQ
jgi:hypothetical protein